MSNWRPVATRATLTRRAVLLDGIRDFFRAQAVLEVDTPALSAAAVSDPNVNSLQTRIDGEALPHYLHSSPEFPMKRLLAAGSGDIYQVCKVFRQGEVGRYHNPEFSLLEWYRLGFDHHDLMDEMEALLAQIAPELNQQPAQRFTYYTAFSRYIGVDVEADIDLLAAAAASMSEAAPTGIIERDAWLDWLMSRCVAPQFPRDRLTFIYDYPASQAALARIRPGEPAVAERFEVYCGAIELANGFHELTNADEQYRRFQIECDNRRSQELLVPPIDRDLIEALRHGLPDCAGVALGLDRLLMVCMGKVSLQEVLAFPFERR